MDMDSRPADNDSDLEAALARDDLMEDQGMHPDDRGTCWTHQSWAEDCAEMHRPWPPQD
jgi:hypothetical protein